jgi:arylsulfatase A-like enzyme
MNARFLLPLLAPILTCQATAGEARRPSIVLIITDDQGYGDLGCHGNPKIRTPTIDAFAKQSVQLRRFYVSPVCSPTRASLMTGRYNYRTGVVDTALGRALMYPDEVTVAEVLGKAGYRTGIFGKWHLGDNYPMRPQDQGFQETLVLKGGGIGQPSDPPGGSSYFDPVLQHNGKEEKFKGYCSDVFTDAAIDFINRKDERPFFAYVAFNCPHTPLQVADEEVKPYRDMDLSLGQFPKIGLPLTGKYSIDDTARIYAMVTNIDRNLGRLFARLDEARLTENTIVVFMTDNGPQQVRWNAGLRGRKGTVYEGGIRVPCYARWPGQFAAGRKVDSVAAHIDILPTLLEACGVPQPQGVKLDGRSLLPLLRVEKGQPTERTIYLQWHRGDVPERGRAFTAIGPRHKLAQAEGATGQPLPKDVRLQLFNIVDDPYEQTDLVDTLPDVVADMKKGYEAWFDDVSTTRGFAPSRIHIGADAEPVSVLTRQDWRGPKAGWRRGDIGFWEVLVERAGPYQVEAELEPLKSAGAVTLEVNDSRRSQDLAPGAERALFQLELPKGEARLQGWAMRGDQRDGVKSLKVKLDQSR